MRVDLSKLTLGEKIPKVSNSKKDFQLFYGTGNTSSF